MHILNQVQLNLIYNTNHTLFLWIEIFICTTDLYSATADRWSCHLPNRNVCATQVLPMGVGRSALCVQISRDGAPANILIPFERQLIALQFAADSFYIMKLCITLLVLYCGNCPTDDKFRYLIPILSKLGAA